MIYNGQGSTLYTSRCVHEDASRHTEKYTKSGYHHYGIASYIENKGENKLKTPVDMF